jgi:hypothetical protein
MLYRMLTGERFSICAVRECLGVTHPELFPDRDPTFVSLKLWANVRFEDMPGGARGAVVRHTLLLFALAFDCADMDELARAAGIEPVHAKATATEAPAHTGDGQPHSGDGLPRHSDGALAPIPVPSGWSHVIA